MVEIDKLKRYNQILLAILGTTAVAGGLIGLIILVFVLIWELAPRQSKPEGVVADSVAKDLVKKNLRKQILSLANPEVIDSVNNVYLMPVAKIDLEAPERISKYEFGSGSRSESSFEGGDYHSQSIHYNLLVYSSSTQEITPVFQERLAIIRYDVEKISDQKCLFIETVEKDTDKNGILNGNDLAVLYLYWWEEKKLKKIGVPDAGYLGYYLLLKGDYFIIRFGIDKNQDGQFSYDEEPNVLFTYNVKDQKLAPLLSSTLAEQLQQTLEGQRAK